MASKLETLKANLEAALWRPSCRASPKRSGELTIVVKAGDYLQTCATRLRDDRSLGFEQLIDLCGVDYSTYGDGAYDGPRFAAVLHLLSMPNNWRLRVRVFAPDDEVPIAAVCRRNLEFGRTGTSAKHSTCTASCSKATRTCAAS